VYGNALVAPAPASPDGYVDGTGRSRAQPELCSSRPVAENGPLADRQHSRHVRSPGEHHFVPDEVDPAVDRVQPSDRDAVINRAFTETGGNQLLPAYDPVLLGRKICGYGITRRCAA
jgi:hypothetical protein